MTPNELCLRDIDGEQNGENSGTVSEEQWEDLSRSKEKGEQKRMWPRDIPIAVKESWFSAWTIQNEPRIHLV